jgi:two-component system, sensor histidine kinase LadS
MLSRKPPVPQLRHSSMATWAGWVLLVLVLLSWPAAKAQPVIPENAGANVSNAALKLVEVAVLHEVSPAFGLPEILAGQGGSFVPQAKLEVTDPRWDDVDLWMRLTLQGVQLQSGQTAAAVHVLEFPKSYLDNVRLYSPPLPGARAWRVQQAGDTIAQKDWFLRGLYPRFLLPNAQELLSSPEGKQVLYVQIKHHFPMATSAQILSAAQSTTISQTSFLSLGLAMGAMLLTAILVFSLVFLSKDSIFGWYAAYAVAAILTNASHSGLAHLLLWPVQGYWPSTATLFWLLVAACCQLQFCRVLLQPGGREMHLSQASISLGGVCLAVAIAFALLPTRFWTAMYFVSLVLVFLALGLSILLVYLAWRKGNKLALAWMITFVPLFITVVIGLLDSVGVIKDAVGYNLPIYASALEVIVLGLALQWFARERYGQIEREKALAITDPLTGFATAEVFQSRIKRSWERRQGSGQDLAVAYVQIMAMGKALQAERMLTRSVRVLRAATRSQDVVARLESDLLAISMPDIGMGDDLSQRLSRIVALGLMPDVSDPQATVLQFRIAASTRKRFKQDFEVLDRQLRDLLVDNSVWGSKPIRYVDHRINAIARKRTRMDSEQLEDFWDLALAQQLAAGQDSSPVTPKPT